MLPLHTYGVLAVIRASFALDSCVTETTMHQLAKEARFQHTAILL